MFKIKKILIDLLIILLILFVANLAKASNYLYKQRIKVIKNYIELLDQGNYKTIPRLFTKNAITISSSGAFDHPNHFYKTLFTKSISNPHASLKNIFEGKIDINMLVGYFDFSWTNKKGNTLSAKFLDLFVFQHGTSKIENIYIFSNTFKQDIMKHQLYRKKS